MTRPARSETELNEEGICLFDFGPVSKADDAVVLGAAQ